MSENTVSSEKEAACPEATPDKQPAEAPENLISFDNFLKVQIRVGQIIEAEKIEKSNKLVRLQVDLGEETGPRQIVAGIARHYEAETLVGRKIAVVANLKPAKLMGVESRGMLLAASDADSGRLELVNPGNDIPVGSKIS
jgi:methionyl-tRNA synthetase